MSGMNGLLDLRRQQWERNRGTGRELLEFEILKRVEDEQWKLFENRDLVREKVEATEETEKVNDAVEEWLNGAHKLIKEVRVWLMTERKIELYSNMLLNKMKMLNGKCKFEPFSIPIPGLEYFSCANFVRFNSTEVAFDQLFEALNDRSSNIIGLYGSQGSGKTTLAKAVGEKAKYLKIFDAVLFVTVSQNSNVQILDQLVNSLNLRLDKNTETGRAIKIYLTLERMGPILVILDDVYEKLKLEDIGIFPNDGNRCKVLLITRYRQVCTLMNCQWKIPVQPLNEEEAWTLLKKYSGIDDESSSELLLDVAKKVASKCNRLPGTIKEVGSSLKSKPIEEWEASLHCLGHSNARYQIFLSFRGKDTRYSFTGSLYHALCREGFKTFMDKDGLKSGNQISNDLTKAINESRLSIIVFSENYAHSSWCLEELVTVLECMKTHHQEVLPIFYKVDPSNLRHQKNTYGEAMAKHENTPENDPNKVKRWRSALYEVANLCGEHYRNDRYEYELIQKIVEKINNMKSRLYIQTLEETVDGERREKILNPSNNQTSFASMTSGRTCGYCGEKLILMTSKSSNNPRQMFWRCPNWKRPTNCNHLEWVDEEVIDEGSSEQQLEEQKKKTLKSNRKIDIKRKKENFVLSVVVSWVVAFLVCLGCIYMLKCHYIVQISE